VLNRCCQARDVATQQPLLPESANAFGIRRRRVVIHPPGCHVPGRGNGQSNHPHDLEGISAMSVTGTTDGQQPIPRQEQTRMSTQPNSTPPIQRLSRVQQLTLNTWRLASDKLQRVLDPCSILEYSAIHAVLAILHDVNQPIALFGRHASADPELALVNSLVANTSRADLAYDILDSAFLLRWNALVAGGVGPEELPPLRPASKSDCER